jgi:hypothetical protein
MHKKREGMRKKKNKQTMRGIKKREEEKARERERVVDEQHCGQQCHLGSENERERERRELEDVAVMPDPVVVELLVLLTLYLFSDHVAKDQS